MRRNCPICDVEIIYKDKWYFNNSIEKNRTCLNCRISYIRTEEHRERARNLNLGKVRPKYIGKIISKRNKKLWSNRKHTDETRNKMRISAAKLVMSRIKGNRTYNPLACKLFNLINEELQWNGVHAENGGEFFVTSLGYWVDYYEPNHNVVIEFDEKHHEKLKNKSNDQKRQNRIMENLNCKFFRIKYNQNWEQFISNLKIELNYVN